MCIHFKGGISAGLRGMLFTIAAIVLSLFLAITLAIFQVCPALAACRVCLALQVFLGGLGFQAYRGDLDMEAGQNMTPMSIFVPNSTMKL